MRMAAKLLITMGPPCYRSHQRLWSVIVPMVVNLTLRYGHIPQIGYSHPAFGGLLAWVSNDYGLAKEFGELATQLMTCTFDAPSDRSVFHLMLGSSVRHWSEHLKAGSRDYALASEIGSACGNLQYAAYAFGHNMYCRLYAGTPLPELVQESQRSLAFSRTRLNHWAVDLLEGGLKIFGGLMDAGPGPDDDPPWEMEYLRQVEAHQNIQVECIYKVLRAFAALLLGQNQRALAWSDRAEPLIYTVGTQGLLPWPEHVFARALILTALYADAAPDQQAAWRIELDRMREQLRLWAAACPQNFTHKQSLAAAEYARIEGRVGDALRFYHEAAQAAAAGGFLQWQGLAHERIAAFCQERGQGRLAQAHWQEAYRCYHRWGAAAKLRVMETTCREQLGLDFSRKTGTGPLEEKLEPEFRQRLLDESLRLIRTQALGMSRAPLEVAVEGKASELAAATDRLRVEMAERKQSESHSRRFRELLAREVQQRTTELEASRSQLAEAHAATLTLMQDAIAARDHAQATLAKLEREVAERERAEAALLASLAEKTVLLKEVHHRVKNNLQIVSSLLDLQERRTQDDQLLDTLASTRNRVRSMALIHEKLYQTNNLAHLDLASYLETLCRQLHSSAGSVRSRVRIESWVTPPTLAVGLDQAVPCGLVINELVTNALKYAFPGERAGRIQVSLQRPAPREVLLTVADDGVGLPAALDPGHTVSLGLKLVFLLTAQLHGTVTFERASGTAVQIRFPNPSDPTP